MAAKKKEKQYGKSPVQDVLPQTKHNRLLLNWKLLNEEVGKLTEQEALDLLEQEKAGRGRINFLLRLYGRFNSLRTARERNNLAGGKL